MTDKTLGAYERHEKHDAAHDIDWQAVAEQHEDTIRALVKDRDEARRHEGVAAEQATEQARLAQKALRERDEAVTELRLYELREKLTPAAVSRPLTPDAIDDEMVLRFMNTYDRLSDGSKDAPSLNHFTAGRTSLTRSALTAALTEPPARPEWADLEDVLDAGWPEGINGAENGHIARTLHEGGVRVVGEDDHAPACEGGPGQPCGTCASYWAGDQEEQP